MRHLSFKVIFFPAFISLAYAKPEESKTSELIQQEQSQIVENVQIPDSSADSPCSNGWVHWVINNDKSACCPASPSPENDKRSSDESLEKRARFKTTRHKKKYGKAKGKNHARRDDVNETSYAPPQWRDCYIITTQPPVATGVDNTVKQNNTYIEDDVDSDADDAVGVDAPTETAQKGPSRTPPGGRKPNTGWRPPPGDNTEMEAESNGGTPRMHLMDTISAMGAHWVIVLVVTIMAFMLS